MIKEYHEVGIEGCDDVHHCFSHNIDEGGDDQDFYRQCGECGHFFITEQNLIDDHNECTKELNKVVATNPIAVNVVYKFELEIVDDASAIYSCPHCLHDF